MKKSTKKIIKKLPTVSVGIPAYNEEHTIKDLIISILKQKQISFKLEKIFVVCDGCSDNTADIARKVAKKHKNIVVVDDKKRLGKAQRLNMIYSMNKSDYLATFDADILLKRAIEIEIMMKRMLESKKTQVVCARIIPVEQESFMGKISVISYKSFEDAVLRLNGGNNYFAMVGCASLLRKSLSKSFSYPEETISDQNYLYTMAIRKNKDGVRLAKDTQILFRTVTTFEDWRILGVRSVVMDKANVASLLGDDVLNEYRMPRWIFFTSLLKWLIKSPMYTTGSILMNMYIRIFPLRSAYPQHGIWSVAMSSKFQIF